MKAILLCDENLGEIEKTIPAAEVANFRRIYEGGHIQDRGPDVVYFSPENIYPPVLNHVHTNTWVLATEGWLESKFEFVVPDDKCEWFEINHKMLQNV